MLFVDKCFNSFLEYIECLYISDHQVRVYLMFKEHITRSRERSYYLLIKYIFILFVMITALFRFAAIYQTFMMKFFLMD